MRKPADHDVPRARWGSFIEEFGLSRDEQTCRGLRETVEAGRREEALAELATMRRPGDAERRERPIVPVGGSRGERRIAKAIAQLVAARAALNPDVIDMRLSICGRGDDPLTMSEAWAMLDAPESVLAGNHHGGPMARLTFPSTGRNRAVVDRLKRRGADPGEVLVPHDGPLWASARRLATFYRWTESAAAWFLLAGEPPTLHAVAAQINTSEGEGPLGATITITALPHASDESVAETFKKARLLLEGGRGPSGLRRRFAAEFVKQETVRAGGKRPPWEKLRIGLNATVPPEWRYGSDAELARACGHEKDRAGKPKARRRARRRETRPR
jgi:hypothetical protein